MCRSNHVMFCSDYIIRSSFRRTKFHATNHDQGSLRMFHQTWAIRRHNVEKGLVVKPAGAEPTTWRSAAFGEAAVSAVYLNFFPWYVVCHIFQNGPPGHNSLP